jgi:hypothetical protein
MVRATAQLGGANGAVGFDSACEGGGEKACATETSLLKTALNLDRLTNRDHVMMCAFLTSALAAGVVTFTSQPPQPREKKPWYPLDKRPGGPQNRSVRGGQ